MPRITALEQDPRRPDTVRVMVDGRLFCTVPQASVPGAALRVGAEFTSQCADSAGRAADEAAAWRAVLTALERRSHASAQLRQRLIQRGHPPVAVDCAIARALAAKLLDDREFTRQFARSRRERGRGPARVRRDLGALGVAREHIEAAVAAEWATPEDALAQARAIGLKRARQLVKLPIAVRRRRLLSYLARRGFTGHRVNELVRNLLAGEGAGAAVGPSTP